MAGKHVLKNNPSKYKDVRLVRGSKILYQFRIFKDGKLKESVEYDESNQISFIPDECGEYEIEVKVKHFYLLEEYVSNISDSY